MAPSPSAVDWAAMVSSKSTCIKSLAGGGAAREIASVKLRTSILAAACVVCSLPVLGASSAHATDESPSDKSPVLVVPIRGPISEAQFFFLRRAIKQADATGAAAVVLDLDTPGGALSATEKMDQALLKARMPVFAYINPNAASAGALIALATKGIYMAPVSAIGAAAPVTGSGQELEETMSKKVVSYYSGYFRSVAGRNDHNPELVDAFMNLDKEVKIGDRVLNPKGALLTLSAQEAVETIEGKPVLARGIADSVEDVIRQAGFSGHAIERVAPTGFESIAQWITVLAPLFLMGGIVGAYIEFKTGGFGVAGILAIVCFLLFFAGHYVAGLTGFEVAAVFLLGLALFAAEFLFFPGLVILATLGVALMAGSLFFAMMDFYPGAPPEFSFEVLATPVMNFSIAVVLAVVVGAVLARFLPELPIFRRLILDHSTAEGPSLAAPREALFCHKVSVGQEGVAETLLRPAGKVKIGELMVDAQSDGEFLPPGTHVRVLEVSGAIVLVGRRD